MQSIFQQLYSQVAPHTRKGIDTEDFIELFFSLFVAPHTRKGIDT